MRVGDFYEFYGPDAEVAATALQITLTAREDQGQKMPMAGVPFHSVEKYLARLLAQGIKVALCDQIEDPKQAKGLVKRAVTRVLTPGTLVEDSMLPGAQNNFLSGLAQFDGKVGFALLDPSTGEFLATEFEPGATLAELARVRPAEVLVSSDFAGQIAEVAGHLNVTLTLRPEPEFHRAESALRNHFQTSSLQGFGLVELNAAIIAASMVLQYASENGLKLDYVDSISVYSLDSFMVLDPATRQSLELCQNLSDGSKRFTLLSVLDRTVTPMGSRLIRRWTEQPLLSRVQIESRLDAVSAMKESLTPRDDIRDILKGLHDLERVVARTATGTCTPRDLGALRFTLLSIPELEGPLLKVRALRIRELADQIDPHPDLAYLLRDALVDEPPFSQREGGMIRDGFDNGLDKLRALSRDAKQFIAELEATERVSTGISTLKVGYNAVFGYYLEVSKTNISKVPAHYIRKQTTANAERYITAELKEHESAVLGSGEKAATLENDLFVQLRQRVADHSKSLLKTAAALAELDALAALGEVAAVQGYCRPEIVEEDILSVRGGRHPVVESNTSSFVPNDAEFTVADGETRLMILTGPNMSGKSTYLRQLALIIILAQMGSYVPAESCRMGLSDRVFARIGARDEIALGQSTFMVEMLESAQILNNATERSFVILDEVGRGTSTYDGLAIAWAMAEELCRMRTKVVFATHYHQLNALSDQLPGVENFRIAVQEFGEELVWTHKVLAGGTDKSYGVHVARMAGVPLSVVRRAAEVLAQLENKPSAVHSVPMGQRGLQLTLFDVEDPPVVQALQKLNLNEMTPMEALSALDQLQREAKRRP